MHGDSRRSSVRSAFHICTKAWDVTPPDTLDQWGKRNHFAGYGYLRTDYTDSAAAATALATGDKSYNSAIHFDDFSRPLESIVQRAKEWGRATGSISSVPISDATPAALGGAQNVSRGYLHHIANQMLDEGMLDVWMGGGHPLYDDNGQLRDTPEYTWISEADLNRVVDGETPWTLISAKEDVEKLAARVDLPTGPLLGIARVAATSNTTASAPPLWWAQTTAFRAGSPSSIRYRPWPP